MYRFDFRPALLTAAFALAFPMALSAQTAPGATKPDARSTRANSGVPAASGALEGERAATLNSQGNVSADKADRDFMRAAAGAGLYEVAVSRLAAERATQPKVREFAEKMVSDHTDANQELAALAKARGVQLPQEIPESKQKVIDSLKKSSNFDEDYVKTVGLEDHKADIALFDKAHRASKDEELKTWVGEKLPILETHLTYAQELSFQSFNKSGRLVPPIKAAPSMPEPSSLTSEPPAAKGKP